MECRNSLHQPLRSDLGVLIIHPRRSGLPSIARLNLLCAASCVRLSITRATLAQVSANFRSSDTVKASGGDDTSRFVDETHRAVTLSEQSHLNTRPGHLGKANGDRCVH